MLDYHKGKKENENWIITETKFDPLHFGKCETIMALGNGYLGLRATHEENYTKQTRNLFVSGTFNKFDETEPTELPNIADIVEMDIMLNDERFSLELGSIILYERSLSLKTGELTREIIWESPKGKQYNLLFKRFVSLKNKHLICQKVYITPLTQKVNIVIKSGINGQVSNSGAQHFNEGIKRIYDKKILEYKQTTTSSNVDVILHSTHTFNNSSEETHNLKSSMEIGRRKLTMQFELSISQNETVTLEKVTTIHSSLDKPINENIVDINNYVKQARLNVINEAKKGYDKLLTESINEWITYWKRVDIKITSIKESNFDQVATRFAQYHLLIMTPVHDNRFGIGAKGLTGEGYKGHSFWDSEIFIMPYFLYTQPSVARSLLEYRYLTLEGARKKAQNNGYQGVMYPWESALTGDEETPVWGAVNVETGESTKIWSGFLEQHITGDIAYAIHHYFRVTNDESFMKECGYEILFETANFWASRLERSENRGLYEINQVIGPDEYKEHVDNNAFTNYLADWNIQIAIDYYNQCKEKHPEIFNKLNKKIDLLSSFNKWTEVEGEIYLPQPNEQRVIPQDDTYLDKKVIDITPYTCAETTQTILKDYSRDQVIDMQVSKQADVVMLLYMFRDNFTWKIKKSNFEYYEPKTIHDSSLSMAVHTIVACDIDDTDVAYECFLRAASIDLGQNMKSSDLGIHAASLGGVWKSILFGFAGLSIKDNELHLNPKLPKEWEKLVIPFFWRGNNLSIQLEKDKITIKRMNPTNDAINLVVDCKRILLKDEKTTIELVN